MVVVIALLMADAGGVGVGIILLMVGDGRRGECPEECG